MHFDPERHHRRSIRLSGYDYTQAGAYFVTICTHQRQHLLAHIDATGRVLSHIGRLVARCWLAIPRHFPNAILDAWVIMPDHLHGIIVLQQSGDSTRNAEPAVIVPSKRPNGTVSGSLPAVIQNFKAISTRKINRLTCTAGTPLWQRNYYEHIIRDEHDLCRIRQYIEANPSRWASESY
jgi:putative transposase